MHTRQSGVSASDNAASDPSARPGHLLSNPAVQRRFYDTKDSDRGPPGPASGPRDARNKAGKEAQLLKKHARCRNWAVWAQALVLFNVIGIPLSQGVYVEHYYTVTLLNRTLTAVSIIPAFQALCLLAAPTLAGWLYHCRGQRSGWRIMFIIAALVGAGAELAQQWVASYALTVVLQGLVLGGALGTLFALSTLVLSSHYMFNLPLISMQSGIMGFAGAVLYTAIARQGFGAQSHRIFAPATTASVMLATLCMALLLIRRVEIDELPRTDKTPKIAITSPKGLTKIAKERGTLLFVVGEMLIFFGLLVFPTYLVTILGQPLALMSPDLSAFVLFTAYAVAAMSACVSANESFRKRLGPLDTFIAATLLASAASIMPTLMPSMTVALICGAVYGIGLGPIFALHIKVSTVFHHEKVVWHSDMAARAAFMMVLCGVSAFAGLLASGFIITNVEDGVNFVAYMAAGSMGLGGILVAIARWLRCGKFYVAI